MAGKLTFTLQEFQEAATKWRSDLLMLPIIGIQETLKYMTARPGIRYKENVGALSGDAQFGPYKPSRSTDFNLNVDYRTLETFMGSVVAKFEPNSAVSTLLGQVGATKGDGQMKAPTALHVLALIARGLSEHLNEAIWAGKRNAAGDTTIDLFDGFDTITDKEITSGAIAAEEGNYLKLTEEITSANAVDAAKEILFSLDPRLRSQDLYCSALRILRTSTMRAICCRMGVSTTIPNIHRLQWRVQMAGCISFLCTTRLVLSSSTSVLSPICLLAMTRWVTWSLLW